MERESFEQLVEDGFLALPEQFRSRVKNVALMVEDEPSPEVRMREGLQEGETLLGHYSGVPLSQRGESYSFVLPDTITIYQKPIEEEAGGDPEYLRHIVFDTVWHEVGHYLGLDEDGVQQKEFEKGIGHYRTRHI